MGQIEEFNKSIVERFTEAFNSRRTELLDDVVAPDFVRHCQATPFVDVRSREDFKRFVEMDAASTPDGCLTPRLLVAEGDYVAMFGVYAGTQAGPWGPFPATGKRYELECSGVCRIADGKIAEMWITWDNLAAMMQLGLMPAPA